jgi:hypothetical protein
LDLQQLKEEECGAHARLKSLKSATGLKDKEGTEGAPRIRGACYLILAAPPAKASNRYRVSFLGLLTPSAPSVKTRVGPHKAS